MKEALGALGVEAEIIEFPESTRTSEDAARAVGTTVERIVKSLVFLADGKPILVLASGANRVDARKLAQAVGATRIGKADAEQVRRATGFAIGGVPPLGHAAPLPVFADRDLLALDLVYAAAGTPHAVFGIQPATLLRVTGAQVVDLAEGRP